MKKGACFGVPEPRCFVLRAAGDQGAVRRIDGGGRPVGMTLERMGDNAGFGVGNLEDDIRAGADHLLAVGGQIGVQHPMLTLLQRLRQYGRFRCRIQIPDVRIPIEARADQLRQIGGKADRLDGGAIQINDVRRDRSAPSERSGLSGEQSSTREPYCHRNRWRASFRPAKKRPN